MVRNISVTAVALSLAFLIGCSGLDSTQVLVHPETAAPSATIDVALVNLYMYIDTAGSIVSKNITRDSLHLLVGMSASWEVTEAKMAVVNDLTANELFALQNNLADPQAVAGLLTKYRTSATALGADDALAGKLAGDPVMAHGPGTDEDIPVAINTIPKVNGFGAPVSIKITKGSRADTTFALDSVLAFIEDAGLVTDSTMATINSVLAIPGVKKPDSLGFVMVPVVIYLKLKAGGQEGADTLYYFTKTGSMNQAPSPFVAWVPSMKPMLTSLETGDMAFVPITVSSAAATRIRQADRLFRKVTAATDPASGTVRIDLGSSAAAFPVISIYSLQGNLVTDLGPQSGGRNVVWNGIDGRGNRVTNGTYLIRIAGVNGSVVRRVQLMK
jgi:hypothetical protein